MQEALESATTKYSGGYLPEALARDAVVEVGRRQYIRGFVAANDGNISIRIGADEVLITPSGRSKGFLKPDELVKVDLSGRRLQTGLAPSSELPMHLAIYRARPEVRAVVHAHPPICTGFSVAGIALDKCVLAEVVMTLGAVPIAEFAPPSTEQLAQAVGSKIAECDALLLANHGAVTVGTDIFAAHYNMERLEHFALITLVARVLGGERVLSAKQVEQIAQLQKASGTPLPPLACRVSPDWPSQRDLRTASPSESRNATVDRDATNVPEDLVEAVVAALSEELSKLSLS